MEKQFYTCRYDAAFKEVFMNPERGYEKGTVE